MWSDQDRTHYTQVRKGEIEPDVITPRYEGNG
jgi:hypothetical protein